MRLLSLLVLCTALAAGSSTGAADAARAQSDASLNGGTAELGLRAKAGDMAAAYELGGRIANGLGTARNMRIAAEWYEKAAAAGYLAAQFSLGFLYLNGGGEGPNEVAADPAKARHWLTQAAEGGHLDAQYLAGSLLLSERTTQSENKARSWLLKAAQRGIAAAQFDSGLLLTRQGGRDALIDAYRWFDLAARAHYPGAAENRDLVGAQLTTADLSTIQDRLPSRPPG